MIGWSQAVTALQAGQVGFEAAAMGQVGELAARTDRTRLAPELLGNFLLALFYGLFLYSAVTFWIRTGDLVSLGLVLFNTLVVVCLLTRRCATTVTTFLPNWILATLVQLIPLLLRPAGSGSGPLFMVSAVGQVAGLTIMIASLMALNRSFGIVAANRGIKTGGLYAWVRHPLYAGEILFFVSFLTSAWSYQNASLILGFILVQVVRAHQEEALLLGDERYAAYKSAVRYRLIPVFFKGTESGPGSRCTPTGRGERGQGQIEAGIRHEAIWP